MATPKRKVSHARTSQRKANWLGALSTPAVMTCPKCGEVTLKHHACPNCGFYRGHLAVKSKAEAAE